jgi:hypothetical protein
MSNEQEKAALAAQGVDTLTAETAPDMTEEDLLAYLGESKNTSTKKDNPLSKTSDLPIEFEEEHPKKKRKKKILLKLLRLRMRNLPTW